MNFTDLVIPAATFATIIGALLKIILWQNDKRMDERFGELEAARTEASKNWDQRYGRTESSILELERSVAHWSERMVKVEAAIAHVPTHIEMQKINTDLARLQGETNTQTELLKRLDRQMSLINEWMMENK